MPTSTIPPFFYRPDALPAAQPTVSKHWRQAGLLLPKIIMTLFTQSTVVLRKYLIVLKLFYLLQFFTQVAQNPLRIPRVFHVHRNSWVFQVCGHPTRLRPKQQNRHYDLHIYRQPNISAIYIVPTLITVRTVQESNKNNRWPLIHTVVVTFDVQLNIIECFSSRRHIIHLLTLNERLHITHTYASTL